MAHTNATRYGEIAQKKGVSVLAIVLEDALYKENGLTIAAGNANFLVANLPANAVIKDAYVNVEKASNAATTATVQLGTAEGGAQVLAALDVKTVGVAGTLVGKLATGTGQPIYMKVALAGATTTVGKATLVVEYTEYEKNTGEYTQFS